MKVMITVKKSVYKILRKFGIVGKEYQLLPSNFPEANINNTFNQLAKLHPRVTHPTEYVVLGILASITKQNILEVGCYLGYSSCIMASAISSDRKIFSICYIFIVFFFCFIEYFFKLSEFLILFGYFVL